MSRFFRGGDDSSTDSSSEEESLYTDEEELEQHEGDDDSEEESTEEEEDSDEDDSDDDDDSLKGAARFLRDVSSDSDDSDEEVRTKVKSAKDRRFDELEGIIKAIENAKKINDWGTVATGTIALLCYISSFPSIWNIQRSDNQ